MQWWGCGGQSDVSKQFDYISKNQVVKLNREIFHIKVFGKLSSLLKATFSRNYTHYFNYWKLGAPRVEPVAAAWEAETLPPCYAIPHSTLKLNTKRETAFEQLDKKSRSHFSDSFSLFVSCIIVARTGHWVIVRGKKGKDCLSLDRERTGDAHRMVERDKLDRLEKQWANVLKPENGLF